MYEHMDKHLFLDGYFAGDPYVDGPFRNFLYAAYNEVDASTKARIDLAIAADILALDSTLLVSDRTMGDWRVALSAPSSTSQAVWEYATTSFVKVDYTNGA